MEKGITVLVGFVCCLVVFNAAVYGQGYGVTVAGQASGEAGSDSAHLNLPLGLFVDDNGNIYVGDEQNGRVQKWIPGATSGVTVAGGNGWGNSANQITSPYGLFVDRNDNVYVSDGSNGRIQKWIPGATSGITVVGGNLAGNSANPLFGIAGLFVDGNGNIYVADQENHSIQKWLPGATSGITVAGGNGPGHRANQLFYPTNVFLDQHSNMYITDMHNNRILKWDFGATSGVVVAGDSSGSWGSSNCLLSVPESAFVDSIGNIYIADVYNNRIQMWASGANCGTTVAGQSSNIWGASADSFNAPIAVFLDRNGNIYISDRFNNRVQKWIFGNSGSNKVSTTTTTLSLYPSPTNSELTIEAAGNKVEQVRVFNVNGVLVQEVSNPVNNKVVVNELPNSIYFIEATVKGTLLRAKFVKE